MSSSLLPSRPIRLLPLAVCLAALCLARSGQAAEVSEALRHETYRLDNGLTVILHEDHTLPLVAVDLWYQVGSAHEPVGRSGFAHLFEHLMFTGTGRVPANGFDRMLEAGGAWNNASTDYDRTDYYEVGPAHLLPTMLWLEADRMEALGDTMTQEQLDLQRDVVRNERRESYDDAPYGAADLMVNGLLFPPGHPYHQPVIGSHEDLERATVADVKSFFATWYVPNNATLVVAGDFEPAATKALIRRLFAGIPPRALPAQVAPPAVERDDPVRVTVTDDVQAGRLTFAWHSPAFYAPGDAAMDVIAAVLAGGRNSRLERRLVHEEGLATTVYAWQESLRWSSIFQIEVTAASGVSLDELERAVDQELAALQAEGPTAEELERILAKLETGTLEGLQSLLAVADQLNHYEAYLGAPDRLAWDLARYRSLGAEDVATWATRILDPGARVTLRVVPEASTDRISLDERPPADAPRSFTPPLPETFLLPNGLEVWLFERPELQLVNARLVLPAGSRRDPAGAPGVARLTAKMLTEGAGELDAAAFAARLERMGARLSAYADRDATVLDLFTATRHADASFALLAAAARSPTFEEAPWARIQARHVDRLRQRVDDPDDLARRASRAAYWPSSAYGRAPDGTPDAIAGLELGACRAFHEAAYGPRGGILLIAGSLDAAAARRLVEQHLGSWEGPRQSAPPMAQPTPPDALRVLIVDRPDATQTVIRTSFPGIPAGHPRRAQLDVLNALFGGNFISRLNANLRESHGYTYGAWSSFECWVLGGVLGGGASVQTEVTGAALREYLGEFRKIRTGDIQEEEAQRARASLGLEAVTSFQQLAGVLNAYEPFARLGARPSAFAAAVEQIARADVETLGALAREHVIFDVGLIVLVGDAAQILPQLEGLGLPAPDVVAPGDVLADRVRRAAEPAAGPR